MSHVLEKKESERHGRAPAPNFAKNQTRLKLARRLEPGARLPARVIVKIKMTSQQVGPKQNPQCACAVRPNAVLSYIIYSLNVYLLSDHCFFFPFIVVQQSHDIIETIHKYYIIVYFSKKENYLLIVLPSF